MARTTASEEVTERPGLGRRLHRTPHAAMDGAVDRVSTLYVTYTWARWERGTLAAHPAFRLLLDLVDRKADHDSARTAARLRTPRGVHALW